jgi:O-antigen ligase
LSQLLGNVIFYALLAVLSLTAIPYGTVEPWWQAIFECAIFTLSLLWVIEAMFSGTWLVRQHRLLIPLVALVVFTLIQAMLPLRSASPGSDTGPELRPISFAPYDTKMVAFQLLALVIAGGLLLRYTTNRRRLMALVYVVVGIGLVSSLFGLLRMTFQHQPGFLLPHLQPSVGTSSSSGGFGQFINHNHFAFLAEMSLGLVLSLMLRRPMRFARLVIGLAIAVPMWIAIVYSGSRGGLISMLGQALFVALLVVIAGPGRQLLRDDSGHERVRSIGPSLVTRVLLAALILVVMVLGIVWVGGDPLASRLESVANELGVKDFDKYARTDRSTIWPITWQMIKDHPLAGVGFGGYWIAITKYHEASGEFTPQQAHNDYLELAASGGLVGIAIALWFVIMFIRQSAVRLPTPDRFLSASRLGAMAGIFAVAIHSVVDFGLHVIINSLVFMILVVIATGLGRVNKETKEKP